MFNGTAGKVLVALEPYKLKQDGRNQYRANSPFRIGSNSHAFTLVIDDDEHGAYEDKVSGDAGSLYQLATQLGIETPKAERKAAEQTKRAYRDLAEYAQAHGIPAEVMVKAGWSDVQMVYDHDDQHRKERPALAFKTAGGTRYRFIDGEKAFYKSEVGYKSCWYGLKGALEKADGVIVLCNGEVSTVTAQHYGVPAICVTSGEKEIPGELLQQLRKLWKGRLLLAYDCDETGRRVAQKVAAQIPDYNPAILDLGFTDGGDLADFCKLYQHEALVALVELADKVPASPKPQTDLELLALAATELASAIRTDARAKQNADLEAVTAKLQAELDRVKMSTAQPHILSFADIAADNLLLIQDRMLNPGAIIGLKSHIPSLDKAVGGFEPEMYVIYGATSMGKSTLAVSLVREFIHQGPGFIATTESNPRRWMMKLVASICKIPSDKIETGALSKQEWELVRDTYSDLSKMGCHMLQSGSPTTSLLRSALLAGMEKYGYEWCVVDSASKMEHAGAAGIYDRTSGVSNGLQSLWQELNIPFIVTTQVGRDVGERPAGKKMPMLEDGYGGGVIEHNAGVVMALYNHQYYVELGTEEANDVQFPPNTALLRILKNRWRGDARVGAVWLTFIGGSGFYECKTVKVDTSQL